MAEKIHDKGYKRLFSNQQFFRELIESFVTEDWVKDIDFTDCQKIDKSFVSAHYKETESDLIYKVKFKDKDAYIYLLLEFQSTVVWHMALRVLNYVSNFYMDYIESNDKVRKLPPIFPLVLYSGDKKWTATNNFRNLLEQPDLLQQYTPQIHYFKIAENEYSSDSLLKMNNLVSMLFLAENHHNIEIISQHLYELFDVEDKKAISILLNWFKQLTLRGKKSLDDYQLLEHIYHSKNEVKAMFDIELEPYAQRHFVEGQAKGEVIGEKRGEKEGERRGERRGEKKGELKGELNSLIIVLETRFGQLTSEQKKKIFTVSKRKLSRLLTESVNVESLAIFFNDIDYEAKNK